MFIAQGFYIYVLLLLQDDHRHPNTVETAALHTRHRAHYHTVSKFYHVSSQNTGNWFVPCPNVDISSQHNAIERIAQCSRDNADLFYFLPRNGLPISSVHVLLQFC